MSESRRALAPLGINELADRIRAAIGAGAFEEVEVMLPQFDRTDANEPWWWPTSAADLDAIRAAPRDFLKSLGLGLWDDEGGKEHWLYPAEWYDSIPEGYPLVSISGRTAPFRRGVTDDDRRCGMLAYGFVRATATPEGGNDE